MRCLPFFCLIKEISCLLWTCVCLIMYISHMNFPITYRLREPMNSFVFGSDRTPFNGSVFDIQYQFLKNFWVCTNPLLDYLNLSLRLVKHNLVLCYKHDFKFKTQVSFNLFLIFFVLILTRVIIFVPCIPFNYRTHNFCIYTWVSLCPVN